LLVFDKVQQQYESKRRLQNKDISLIQIYECDAVTICYIDENKSMKLDDIENIIPSIRENVFTFEIIDINSVEVEFINVSAYKQWMLNVDKIKRKFNVSVTPFINNVDDNETPPSSVQSIPFNINSSCIEKPNVTTIKLRSDWATVAAHPLFKQEYKDYIRNYE